MRNVEPRFLALPFEGGTLTARLEPSHSSICLPGGEVMMFDGEGRLFSAYIAGRYYRRGFDNRFRVKDTLHALSLRRFLSDGEADVVRRKVMARLDRLASATPAAGRLAPLLSSVRRWNGAALAADGERFRRIYSPVPVLPPDHYLAIVLQAAEGCRYNRCTFCTLYRGVRFRVKGPEEFAAHMEEVASFLGRSAGMRRSLFIGDADMLSVPRRQLPPLVRAASERFPAQAAGSIGGFAGVPSVLKWGEEGLRALCALGVSRLYIGLESGSAPLLKRVRKPHTPEQAVQAVRLLKRAGLGAGVITIAGLGGREFAARHIRDTVRVVRAMELGRGDILYISPLAGAPPDGGEVERQVRAMREALEPARPREPIVSAYRLDEFIY